MSPSIDLSPAFSSSVPLLPRRTFSPHVSRAHPVRRARPLRAPPSAKMVRVSVPLAVEAPADYCHQLFSDLSLMPAWSSTLESVTRDASDPVFSDWVFSWHGIRLSWRARDDDPPPGEDAPSDRSIRWRSISGLRHIGVVEFFPEKPSATNMRMTVDYDIASLLAVLMESTLVSTFVESAIQSDLRRFRAYTLRSLRKDRIARSSTNPSS